ncbi:MAG: nucleoside:proton symporter [Magnetococcales bacterium]|nr:nucleoside:proton symporter [Magnetococcales bacterium]MBF0321743.1 nucleoside:proton symporter [Magnetococcales bacterium]
MEQSLLGYVVLGALAWLLSEARDKIRWRVVGAGVLIQFVLSFALLNFPGVKAFFLLLNNAVLALEKATQAGTSFVFGYLGGGSAPFAAGGQGSTFILAFQALPMVLVISALSALLYYWRILPWMVKGVGWALQKGMGVGGALGFGTAATIFIGMIEAPLLIRPYLKEMTRSELFALMTCGMASIAGTVMFLYAGILGSVIPDAMGHILIASLIHAPAALTVAFLMVPELDKPTAGQFVPSQTASGPMDAISQGTQDGLHLFLQIIAFLVVLVALVALVNGFFSLLPTVQGDPLTLQRILGWLMAPVAWLLGIPWSEAVTAGSLLGTKTVLNEFIAYVDLAHLPAEALSMRSRLIMTYAMCGFANLGSLGILIGGLGTMVPERRNEVVAFGFRTILSGTLATCMTGALFGVWWRG